MVGGASRAWYKSERMFVNTTRMRLHGSTCVRFSELGLGDALGQELTKVKLRYITKHRESQVNRNFPYQLLNMSQVATMDWVHCVRSPIRWPSPPMVLWPFYV